MQRYCNFEFIFLLYYVHNIGGGTRKGNGKCSCSREYDGEQCDKCASGFYESFKDDSKLLCSSCHKACAGYCSGPGPKACAKCEKGYEMNTEHGCMVRNFALAFSNAMCNITGY